ncbi:DUF6538 domain-containing protein [Sphingobium nicotianae]|uniref:DUF6538 domain-containing protein n=1 Tax=Sphingobium nicotianae TaxID=2782607 RepID=A0A9X1IR29_9SPHN|nr:DUF6538 domain-containing protein [Sphingobium nicotianae]MBT2186900.1 hypothetical protein [Sphingobium nicotianae]
MAGIWQNPRSKYFWFRMAVPERFRDRVGKREFKYSLETTDRDVARLRHAEKLSEVRALLAQLEAEELVCVDREAKAICQRGLDALAKGNLGANDDGVTDLLAAKDNVAHGLLTFLAYRTRLTWGRDHANLAELELTGEIADPREDDIPASPVGFLNKEEQDAFVARLRALDGDLRYQSYTNRDIARALLARRSWAAAEYEVLLIASAANASVKMRTPLFDALAECVLRYLAEHRFQFWPKNIDRLIPQMAINEAAASAPEATTSTAGVYHLSDCLAQWRVNHRLRPSDVHKTYDEWKLAVDRFIEVHGDIPLDRITRAMVIDYRDLIKGMPTRPAKNIARLPVRDQVALAERQGLRTLAPASVKKHVTAIRSLLEIATIEREWISKNVATKIEVAGSQYNGHERDRLSDADMQTIYGSRYMTDPDACSDTMFWIMFMAPFQGARPGEHCKLRPQDVVREDGVATIRFRNSSSATGGETDLPQIKQKTGSSIRDVPLHWIIAEGGFMDFVALRQSRKAKWLFEDLEADKYGDRYKYLSRQINDALDELGVDASDKAFYSTRHTSKRETRRQRVSEQSADQWHGHSDGRRVGRKYGQGVSIEDLKEDIDKLEYAGVNWDAVVACARYRVSRLFAKHG